MFPDVVRFAPRCMCADLLRLPLITRSEGKFNAFFADEAMQRTSHHRQLPGLSMHVCQISPSVPARSSANAESQEAKLRRTVGRLINRVLPKPVTNERRQDFRYPYPHLVRLTPIGSGGIPLEAESVVVVGKNITERGIDFFHQEALPYRRAILTLEADDGTEIGVLTDLLWTRFTRQGWYDNGGRFIELVAQPESG